MRGAWLCHDGQLRRTDRVDLLPTAHEYTLPSEEGPPLCPKPEPAAGHQDRPVLRRLLACRLTPQPGRAWLCREKFAAANAAGAKPVPGAAALQALPGRATMFAGVGRAQPGFLTRAR